jgi:hypothetical protein
MTTDTQHWYNYENYLAYGASSERTHRFTSLTLSTPVPALIRAGSIIPTRDRMRRSSALMHRDPIRLVIALDQNWQASGDVYVDDGESFMYVLSGDFIHRQLTASGTPGASLRITSTPFVTPTMDPWQRPFLGDAVDVTPVMTTNASPKFEKNMGELVKIDTIVVVCLSPTSRLGVPTVRKNGNKVSGFDYAVTNVNASSVFGRERAGVDGVHATYKIDLHRLNFALDSDWEIVLDF